MDPTCPGCRGCAGALQPGTSHAGDSLPCDVPGCPRSPDDPPAPPPGSRPTASLDAGSVLRCFGANDPIYTEYHDDEWGRPVTDERGLYERVSLEAFQSGLAWITILRKREGFRAAFANFDPEVVAEFGEADHARLLADAGIVRNRLKIEATIANARAILALRGAYLSFKEILLAHPPGGRAA